MWTLSKESKEHHKVNPGGWNSEEPNLEVSKGSWSYIQQYIVGELLCFLVKQKNRLVKL